MLLADSLSNVKFVGNKTFKIFAKKNIRTLWDLWNYFPYKYEDTSNIYTISSILNKLISFKDLFLGNLPKLTIKGVVDEITSFYSRTKKLIIKATITDPKTKDKIYAIWFNQKYILSNLKKGQEYVFYGKAKKLGATFELQAPLYEATNKQLVHLGRLTPVYSQISNISTKYIRRIFLNIRSTYNQFTEYIPYNLLQEFDLIKISDAYLKIHFPLNKADIRKAYYRLAIQELLELLLSKKEIKQVKNTKYLNLPSYTEIIKYSPFKLTNDQQKAIKHLLDYAKKGQNDIFLYGDVGAGKTLVFFLVALGFLKEKYNVILMAPTSTLAYQHFNTIQKLQNNIKDIDFDIQLITAKNKKKIVKADKPTIFIGTHALLHRNYETKFRFGFVTVDEQHKFGTLQRDTLKSINKDNLMPFFLTMSATPIPRTLALTFYGYKQAIYIKEKPKGRKPIKTHLVPQDKISDLLEWIKNKVKEGEQAYIVFPLIEEDFFNFGLLAWHDALKEGIFKDIKLGLLHGKLSETKKQKVMEDFVAGKIQILLSTTVIEVGIDVPNANIITILGAERLGLAQLHQLRGRVGRSDKQAYCFVVGPKIPRLVYFTKHQDGLALAKFDLKNRGPGDIAQGIEQAGWKKLKLASLNNFYLVNKAISLFQKLQENNIQIRNYIMLSKE